jgi:hypothetical protein
MVIPVTRSARIVILDRLGQNKRPGGVGKPTLAWLSEKKGRAITRPAWLGSRTGLPQALERTLKQMTDTRTRRLDRQLRVVG